MKLRPSAGLQRTCAGLETRDPHQGGVWAAEEGSLTGQQGRPLLALFTNQLRDRSHSASSPYTHWGWKEASLSLRAL